MPYINIWERDDTGIEYTGRETIVFVPGSTAIERAELDVNGCLLIKPVPGDGSAVLGNVPSELQGNSYITTLIKSGLQVLYKNVGTFDATTDLDEQLECLFDKNLYNIKFLTSGGVPILQDADGERGLLGTYTIDIKDDILAFSSIIDLNLYRIKNNTGYIRWVEGNIVNNEVECTINNNTITIPTNNIPESSVLHIDFSEDPGLILTITLDGATVDSFTTNIPSGYTVVYNYSSNTPGGVVSDPCLAKSLLNIASKRGDCVVIGGIYADKANDAPLKTLKDSLDNLDFIIDAKDKSSFISLFCAYSDSEATDNEYITSPDLAYFIAYGNAIKNNNTWEALANSARGTIEGFNSKLAVSKYSLDNYVMNAEGRSFNGLINLRPTTTTSGAVIWGDRTLLSNSYIDNILNLKATSFLSIRNMVSDIAKVAYESAIRYTFETNNNITWTNFKGRITNLLDEMVADYKLSTYKIIKKPTLNPAEIKCEIHISPYGPVEGFDIGIILSNANAEVTVSE